MRTISTIILSSLSILCLFSSCGKEAKVDNRQEAKTATLKVMSFNARNGVIKEETDERNWSVRKNAVRKMLEETRPDIVGLQEMATIQRSDLKTLLPDYDLLEVPGTGTSKGGNTVIMYRKSTIEKVKCRSFYLSPTPNTPSVNTWNGETQYRTTIWGEFRIKDSGVGFIFADTHMPLYSTPAGNTARRNSAELNVSMMKDNCQEDTPVFIVGDMNCQSAASGLQPYYDWMSSARETAVTSDSGITYNGYGKGKTILDHIFYRNAIASEYRVINSEGYGAKYISDHYPIMAKFTIMK